MRNRYDPSLRTLAALLALLWGPGCDAPDEASAQGAGRAAEPVRLVL